jgi:hypothetical protein
MIVGEVAFADITAPCAFCTNGIAMRFMLTNLVANLKIIVALAASAQRERERIVLVASTDVFGGEGPGQPSGNTTHAPRLRYVGALRGGYEMIGCSCGFRCDTEAWVYHAAAFLRAGASR